MTIQATDAAALASAITFALMDSFKNCTELTQTWQDANSGFIGFHSTIADTACVLEEAYGLLPNEEMGLVWLYDVGHNVGEEIGKTIRDGNYDDKPISEAISRGLSIAMCKEEFLPLRQQIDSAIQSVGLPPLTWNV